MKLSQEALENGEYKTFSDMERDYYMTVEEAKEYGLIDAVMTKK